MPGREMVAVYPGTFDPITLGHMDIIKRATRIADRLIVAVARNAGKSPLFSTDERVQMVQDELTSIENNGAVLEVRSFDNLLMHFCEDVGAKLIVRGLRAVSDFEYEFQMAGMNTRLNAQIETGFRTPAVHILAFRQRNRPTGRRYLQFRQPARGRDPERPLRACGKGLGSLDAGGRPA
jgi:pantetheine-phosphate adenylyltransferase